MFKDILKNLINIEIPKGLLKEILYIVSIVILALICCSSIYTCTNNKRMYDTNIKALKDTISYYSAKNGQLVAQKTIFMGELDDIKALNEELYDEIENLRIKNDVLTAASFSGHTVNQVNDTIYEIKHDTIHGGFIKEFDFSNEWRDLSGNVTYKNDSLGVNILKDMTYFKYTLAVDDNNVIHISSPNPYIKYDEITGFIVQKQRQKRFSIGPSVGVGYDPLNNKVAPFIGVTLTYGLIRF